MKWEIITTQHTFFVAEAFAKVLKMHNFDVSISMQMPKSFIADRYIVICANAFKGVTPPLQKTYIVQMEQFSAARWWTIPYKNILKSCAGVIEYSLTNLQFLQRNGIEYPHVYHIPIGGIPNYRPIEKQSAPLYDVLFYGQMNDRRRQILSEIGKHFKVVTIDSIFGNPLYEKMRSAKCIINLHFYDPAIIEVVRIFECLSLGLPVVSEDGADSDTYRFGDEIKIVKSGNVQALIDGVREIINKPLKTEIENSVQDSFERFKFSFERFLSDKGFISRTAIMNNNFQIDERNTMVLSLPEIVSRNVAHRTLYPGRAQVFPGIRAHGSAWRGCALSYKFMALQALKQNIERLTIMEDDAVLPNDFDDKMKIIHSYLDTLNGDWDLFSGFIADVHKDTQILDAVQYKGMTFITVDKMTSTVFNVYSRRVMDIIKDWSFEINNPHTNTIDRYLQNKTNLKIVVAVPYLVGHDEKLSSTIWGIKNTQYNPLVEKSCAILKKKIQEFIDKQSK